MGGCIPPHQPKSNDFGQKISLYFKKLGSSSGCIPPHQPKPNDFGRKISLNFGEDLFFFFGDHTWFWAKKTFEFPISAEKSLWISVKTFVFFFFFFGDHLILGEKEFRWRHPNFWGFLLKIPLHQNFLDPPLPMALHARIVEKGSNFWPLWKKVCLPLEQRSSCSTDRK